MTAAAAEARDRLVKLLPEAQGVWADFGQADAPEPTCVSLRSTADAIALADRLEAADDLAAKVTAVEALCREWLLEVEAYPDHDNGRHAAAAVRLCEREIRAALNTAGTTAGGEGK